MNHEDRQPDAVGFMSRHLVALAVDYESFNDDGSLLHRGTMILSGWILELHARLYWVTAGHCFKDLDGWVRDGVVKVLPGGGFMDYFGNDAQHLHVIPYTYEPGCAWYLDKPDLAIDFGLIPLDDLQSRALLANNIVPIGRSNWLHQPTLDFQFYRMLGFPEDSVRSVRSHDVEGRVDVRATMVAVDRLTPNNDDQAQSPDWFVGKIDPAASIRTIKGMSGGPIYGFRTRDDGKLLYHIVALQSWWDPDTRIIRGCSVPMFAENCHLAIEEHLRGITDQE